MENLNILCGEAGREGHGVLRSLTGLQDPLTQEAPHPPPHRGGAPAGPPRDGPEGQPARPQTHVPQAFIRARFGKALVKSHCFILVCTDL